ncbi:hypothetical protein [Actinoplanes derwentensis]|uniref:Uncharacterized protein n=1 Tax=Actinoplanes derwentensis TaxID=113562 RepID=A0A1H2CVQ0_9ACTN|nr:hypothetical protein [Actinoplanes derwentensis]GID82074.1 hypothetical protein Ade03nite_09980 [Actinoplanes derwentensis]SDT74553.1 hypothetical protein SAMN04489716_7017 [Actinoplanes derwentensis]
MTRALTAAEQQLLAAIQQKRVFYSPAIRGSGHLWQRRDPDSTADKRIPGSRMHFLIESGLVHEPKPRVSGAARITDAGNTALASPSDADLRLLTAVQHHRVSYALVREGEHRWECREPDSRTTTKIMTAQIQSFIDAGFVHPPGPDGLAGIARLTDAGEAALSPLSAATLAPVPPPAAGLLTGSVVATDSFAVFRVMDGIGFCWYGTNNNRRYQDADIDELLAAGTATVLRAVLTPGFIPEPASCPYCTTRQQTRCPWHIPAQG